MVKGFLCILVQLLVLMHMQAQQNFTLHECLQMAKTRNPDLKVLQENINSAEADRTTAKLRLNPIFNLQTLHIASARYRQEGTSWNNGVNNQYWYQVTKPVEIAGQRMKRMRVAEQLVYQAQLDFREASRNVYVMVASKWIDVWAARVNLGILMRGKQNIDSLVLINAYRYKDHVITETDLLRTQLLQEQYQRDIVTASQALKNENRNLMYLIGATDSLIEIEDTPGFFQAEFVLDSLLKQALQKRSDVLGAKNNVEVSILNITLQRSLAYPVPEVGGMYNPQNKVPYVGFYGTVEMPLFDRNQGGREKARILKYQAEQNLAATELQAKTEVENAFYAYNTHRNNLQRYEQNLFKAGQILSNVRYSYLRGATTIIDLLEAERSWLDTQQRYYATMEDYRRSFIGLLFAAGSINEFAE